MPTLNTVYNYNNYTFNDLNYDKPINRDDTHFIAPINSSNRVLFQTPILLNVSDTNIVDNECKLELSIYKEDLSFIHFLDNIDKFNIETIYKNSKEWFDEEFSISDIKSFYIKTIKENKVSFNIPINNNTPNINIYNNKRQKIDFTQITNGLNIICILELKGLKFLKQKVVCDWDIIQIKADINIKSLNLTKILLNKSVQNNKKSGASSQSKSDKSKNVICEGSIDLKSEKSSNVPSEKSNNVPSEKSNNEPSEKSNNEPSEKSNNDSSEKSIDITTNKPEKQENNALEISDKEIIYNDISKKKYQEKQKDDLVTSNYNKQVIDRNVIDNLANISQLDEKTTNKLEITERYLSRRGKNVYSNSEHSKRQYLNTIVDKINRSEYKNRILKTKAIHLASELGAKIDFTNESESENSSKDSDNMSNELNQCIYNR